MALESYLNPSDHGAFVWDKKFNPFPTWFIKTFIYESLSTLVSSVITLRPIRTSSFKNMKYHSLLCAVYALKAMGLSTSSMSMSTRTLVFIASISIGFETICESLKTFTNKKIIVVAWSTKELLVKLLLKGNSNGRKWWRRQELDFFR